MHWPVLVPERLVRGGVVVLGGERRVGRGVAPARVEGAGEAALRPEQRLPRHRLRQRRDAVQACREKTQHVSVKSYFTPNTRNTQNAAQFFFISSLGEVTSWSGFGSSMATDQRKAYFTPATRNTWNATFLQRLKTVSWIFKKNPSLGKIYPMSLVHLMLGNKTPKAHSEASSQVFIKGIKRISVHFACKSAFASCVNWAQRARKICLRKITKVKSTKS